MGIKDENKAYIMHVGFADKLPKILLKEFDFKGYEIKIVSYVFNKFNLTESKKSKLFKMIGLLMCKNDAPLLSIDIEYNIKLDDESTNIIDLISTKENIKETNGEFIVLLRKKNDNNVKVLHKFVKYPGNNNLIEKLHKFLWHKEIIYMY